MDATILVVEDDPTILIGVRAALEQAGYAVLTATNGQQGLEQIQQATPDLILSDIMMPVMDGYDFLRALRARPEWEFIPFIFITAKGTPNEIREGMRLGVDDYLPKPFEVDEVVDAVETRLRRVRGVRQASRRELQKLKDRILTMLGHELRTPLTFIKGYSDLAMMERDELDGQSLTQFLSGINVGSERLTRLVDDFLRVVEIEGGQAARTYDMRKVHLEFVGPFIREVVESFRDKAAQRGVTLDFEMEPDLPAVESDMAYLKDALERLLDNAVKFSPQGGRVRVSVGAQQGSVAITIGDEGDGIPLEEQPFIFEAFHQVNRERHEQQGAGLGLTIARGLLDLHGGQISVESDEGVGSTFRVKLPVAELASDSPG